MVDAVGLDLEMSLKNIERRSDQKRESGCNFLLRQR